MHLVTCGSGAPVLFIHGMPTSSRLWNGVISRLCGSYQCFAEMCIRDSSEGEPMPTPSSIPSESMGQFDRLVDWLSTSEKYLVWLQWPFALAAVVYFVFIAIAETGPICRYGHDVFSFLDGGWRIYNGQMPYRDFNLPLGPLEYLIMAGGMLLTKGSTQGIAIGNAAFGIIVAVWGWLLARRRMPVIPALLVTAWLILTATSPTPLGHATPDFPSCAMLYNRHAYALLGLVLVECACAGERSRFWGGFSSGVALALMALLKLNFFGIAGLFLLASVAANRDTMPRFKGCLAGIASVAVAITIYLRLAILTFFSDIWLAVEARRSRLQLLGTIHGLVGRAETLILVLMTVAAVLLIAPGRLRQRRATVSYTHLMASRSVSLGLPPRFRQCRRRSSVYRSPIPASIILRIAALQRACASAQRWPSPLV